MGNGRTLIIAAALGALLPGGAALADAIDGDWCSADGMRNVRISGPQITTMTGQATTGIYDRHAFSFVVPDGDPDAGTEVHMRQMNDEQVSVAHGDVPPEVWQRCKPIS